MSQNYLEKYSLKENELTEKTMQNKLKGGKADKLTLPEIAKMHNVELKTLKKEFLKGVKVESEHTKDKEKMKEIAMDHLVEDPKYYTKIKLAKLEESLLNEEKLVTRANIKKELLSKKYFRQKDDMILVKKNEYEKALEFINDNYKDVVKLVKLPDTKDTYRVSINNKLLGNKNNFYQSRIDSKKFGHKLSIFKESLDEESLPNKLKTDIEIEYHKKLNTEFWLNNHLKTNIRKNLLSLAKFYFKQLDLNTEIKDIIFTGSLANYNYTNLSDIDLHIVIDYNDLTDDDDFAKEFFGDKRTIWADSNQIEIYGYPVEIYVQDVSQLDDKGMGAMYSLVNNKWIKKPKYELPDIDKHEITQKVNKYLDILNKISMMKDSIKKVNAYNKVFEKIRDKRRKATKEEGEFSIDNLVFKVLRNKNVFDIVRNNKKDIVNNVFSMKTN